MGRLAWSQVRFRLARTLALVAGVLVAATAFTVLTAASRTAQVRTTGEVSANLSPAYDILVRPKGARTAVEARTGTVQPDFLSGIYGGITMAQWHQIQQIPGVQVAAPIAMVRYAQLNASIFVPVPKGALAGSGRQLYTNLHHLRQGSCRSIRCRRCRSAITSRWRRRRRPWPAAGRRAAATCCLARTWAAWSASR